MTIGKDEQYKIDIIHKLMRNQISVRTAQLALNKSERTIYRLLSKYRREGACALLHGNKGRTPANSSQQLKNECFSIVLDKYYFLNRTHAREKLKTDHSLEVSKSTFNRWCNENNILTKKVKRPAKKRRSLRPRTPSRGVMLQMDGSYHPWIYNHVACCLIIIVDDANGEILWAEFVASETTVDCMRGIKNVIKNHGAFSILYTDKAGVFGGKRGGFSQVNRALNEIGSTVIHAHSPEAKGRVERVFQTLQDRLVAEMRLFGVSNLSMANKYLQNIFLPQIYNKQFVLKDDIKNEFNKTYTADIDEVFTIKDKRKIARDNVFSFKNYYYQLPEIMGDCRGGYVEIRTYLDQKWKAFYNNREIINLKLMNKNRRAS